METPKAFISFDIDNNNNEKELFISQIEKSGTTFSIGGFSSELLLFIEDLDYLIRKRIDNLNMLTKTKEKAIELVVNSCQMLIVLIGNKTHIDGRVDKEIAYAISQDMPVFGVYIEGVDEAIDLPKGLERRRNVAWDWKIIASTIDDVTE